MRNIVALVVFVAGVVCGVVGTFIAYEPAGFVVLGGALCGAGYLWSDE